MPQWRRLNPREPPDELLHGAIFMTRWEDQRERPERPVLLEIGCFARNNDSLLWLSFGGYWRTRNVLELCRNFRCWYCPAPEFDGILR